MSTLTLTPESTYDPPRVEIVVSTGGPTITDISIRRNGEKVRFSPQLGLASVVVYDYEAEYNTPSTYLVQLSTSSGMETLTGSVTLTSNSAWLVHPRTPSLSFELSADSSIAGVVAVGDSVSRSNASFHRVIGATREVVMSFGNRTAASYPDFVVATTTETESDRLEALLMNETPILVRFPADWNIDFRDGFYSAVDWSARNVIGIAGTWLKHWRLPLVPAAAPKVIVEPDNTYGSGLVYDSYGDALAAQATYFDRLVG